ncbi:MAG: type II toxin-antitoxin system death-on-curing family toxin [bacterium]
MHSIEELSLNEVEYIAIRLAKRWLTFDEPIPDFHTRFPNKLESCLATPFQRFDKKPLYTGLAGKAAILFYLLIKNHPFQNGNKRIAMTVLMTLLYKNNKWLKIGNQEFYNHAMWIASSPPDAKEEAIQYTEKFIKKHLVNY